ncbi:MAG: hypothetical protein J5693_00515 [Bacteroidales bacterium]|nr:hypothetical protein [Bacteroidales bacterium]
MKRFFLVVAAAAALFTSCLKEESYAPTAMEKAMVPEQMTWVLDSITVYYNFAMPEQTIQTVRESDGLDIMSYTFYPYTYSFPEDMYFESESSGEKVYLAKEYKDDFCKFTAALADGTIFSAGYLCYYRDLFTFNGLKSGAWAVFFIVNADPVWTNPVWTLAYDPIVTDDGQVLEHRVEYYHRVE